MGKRVVTVTHPDGTKKVIVSKSASAPVKTREGKTEDRRPKPVTPKISITNEKNGYKYGGKVKFKAC